MSGSWERAKSDESNYMSETQKNTDILNLIMENPGICMECRVPDPGFLSKQGVSMFPDRDMIDVESDLWNIGRHYQKAGGYKPSCPDLINNGPGDGLPCGGGVVRGPERCQPKLKHFKECSFNQLDTRSVLPPCTLRGIGIDRFETLCQDPQARAVTEFPGEMLVSQRHVIIDNHRACIRKPLDQKLVWPKGGPLPCQPINGRACAAFTGDMHPYSKNPYPSGYLA